MPVNLQDCEYPGRLSRGVECQLSRLTLSPADIRRFARMSENIYHRDPLWVAPLLKDLQELLSNRNPFFEHAEIALWVASRNGNDIGRIAGIVDHLHNKAHQESAACFGFFEAVNEPGISHALFEEVYAWARQKGARRLLGPMNPSANNECGLLVNGFESPPVLLMPYNPPYYEELIREEGFAKTRDLLAFYIDLTNCPMDRVERAVARFRNRTPNVQIRPIRRRTVLQDLPKIKEVYNQAWSKNWGFTPMTEAEVDFMAGRLRPLLIDGLAWMAETPSEPVGMLLALPDYNEALKPLRGRLLTPKLFGVLPYLLGRKMPAMARVIALGVKEVFRGRGIEAVMLAEALKVGFQIGFKAAEASWVLEENIKTRRTIEIFGGRPYKTYRLYERCL